MENPLFVEDVLTNVLIYLPRRSIFDFMCTCKSWAKISTNDVIWKYHHDRDFSNVPTSERQLSSYMKEYKRKLDKCVVCCDIFVDGKWGDGADNPKEKTKVTLKTGFGIPSTPFPFPSEYHTAFFFTFDISKISKDNREDFAFSVRYALEHLTGHDVPEPKKETPLPKYLAIKIEGDTLHAGYFYNAHQKIGKKYGKNTKDGIKIFLNISKQDWKKVKTWNVIQIALLERFSMFMIYRHIKKFIKKQQKTQKKSKSGKKCYFITTSPYVKQRKIPWVVIRQLITWESAAYLGWKFSFRNKADTDEWTELENIFEKLFAYDSYLTKITCSGDSGINGTLHFLDPPNFTQIFPVSYISSYNTPDEAQEFQEEMDKNIENEDLFYDLEDKTL